MSNEIIHISSNIDEELVTKIKKLKIDINFRISEVDNLVIKCVDMKDTDDTNTELNLITKYITKDFFHPNFLDYYSIIKIDNNLKKLEIKCNDSFDKLNNYKNNISPMLQKKSTPSKIIDDRVFAYIMPKYEKLVDYLDNNDITPKIIASNILGILDLSILIRDKYKLIHCDVKPCNIIVNNNIFYLIDWEDAFKDTEYYYLFSKPNDGNTEMYPYFDATAEQFFIYSIGILIIRIIGYHYDVTCYDFIQNKNINYILSKIPSQDIELFENVIYNTYNNKYAKIEELRSKIKEILDKIEEDGQLK